MLDYLIFAAISAISLICFIIYIYPTKQKNVLIPGPSPSDPKDGNLGDIVSAHGLPNYLQQLHDSYGPIVSFQWGERVIVSIASPELFAEQEHVFNKPGELFHHYLPLLNTSALFLNNNVEGRRSHVLVEQSLTSTRLGELFPFIYQEVTQRCHEVAMQQHTSHSPLNLQPLAEDLVFYPLMMYFFGASLVNQERELFSQLKSHFDVLWMEVTLNVQVERNICNKAVRESSEKQIRSLLSQLCNRASSSFDDDNDTTVACLKTRQPINKSPQNTALVEDMMALITVSYPPLTALIIWLVYFIKRHPDSVERELLEELRLESSNYGVDSHSKADAVDTSAQAKDCFDWLQRMRFLHCCTEETLRLANIFPWTARVLDLETVIAGYRIPAQTPVIQALSVVHLSEDAFPNADKFLPFRFYGKAKEYLPSLSLVPFGFAGKRRCPGSKLVHLLTGMIISHLWSHYRVEVRVEDYLDDGLTKRGSVSDEDAAGDQESCSECSEDLECDEAGALPFIAAKSGLLVPLPEYTLLISLTPM